MVDHETEIFTVVPTRGHHPVWLNMKGEDTKEVKLKKDLKNANWKGFYECVESLLTERIHFKTMDGNSSWLPLKEALQTASEQYVPVKKVCCFSKLYWCEELSSKRWELRKARKNYRYRSSAQNFKLLRELQQSFQNLVKDKANEYFKSSIEDVNDSRSKEFWKRVNKLLTDKEDVGVSPLLKENKFHSAEKDKADRFRETFFTGKHLEKLSFNEDFKLHVENTLQQSPPSVNPN